MEDTNYRGVQFVTKHVIKALSILGHEVVLLTSHPKVRINVKSERLKERVLNTYFRQYLVNGNSLTKRMAPRVGVVQGILVYLWSLLFKAPVYNIDKSQASGISLVKYFDKAVNLPYFYKFAGAMPKIFRKWTIEKIARQVNADVVYYTFPLIVPKLQSAKVIQIIYDLIPFEIADEPIENEWLPKLAKRIDYVARNADQILTISEDSRNKILEVVPETNVKLVGAAMSAYKDELASYTHNSSILVKLDLVNKPFIVFISSVEKRKNVHRLIQAFISIADRTDASLVIVGNKTNAFKEIHKEVLDAPKAVQKRIVFTGYATEYDKYTLLKNAIALANPTLYEGFGLPVLEAMMLGCPAFSSLNGALKEVCGDATLVVKDPYSVSEIAEALEKILKDTALRAELIKKGYEQAKKYSEDIMYENIKKAIADL